MTRPLDSDSVHRDFLATSRRALSLSNEPMHGDRVLASAGRFKVVLAQSAKRLDATFDLRYRVLGSDPHSGDDDTEESIEDGHEVLGRHLSVVDTLSDEVIAAYRLLTPKAVRLGRGNCLSSAFDLGPLAAIRSDLVELGRVCIDPDLESSLVYRLLWSGIGQYMAHAPFRYLMGCVSLPLQDDPIGVQSLYQSLQREQHVSGDWRIEPWRPMPLADDCAGDDASRNRWPGLLKLYLKAGGKVIGAPGVDSTDRQAIFPLLFDYGAAACAVPVSALQRVGEPA
jgi:putative hemolysin